MGPIKTRRSRLWPAVLLAALLAGCAFQLNPRSLVTHIVDLPLNAKHISFEEITYDDRLNRVILPAAETGKLALINPDTDGIALVSGFSSRAAASTASAGNSGATDGVGVISADAARGMVFAVDRSARKLHVIDPAGEKISASAGLQGTPDAVRFVAATSELWVTEKDQQQIEVFHLSDGSPPGLEQTSTIPVPNGPEGLYIDGLHGLAYTNQPKIGMTVVIQVMTHSIVDQYGNGCSQATGLTKDDDRGFLFVACSEGKLVMMDTNAKGLQLTSINYGGDLTNVVYNPKLKHIYVPSSASAILAVFALKQQTGGPTATPVDTGGAAVTPAGRYTLVRLGTADTAVGSACVTVDGHNRLWVCDPNHGQLFMIPDTFPAGS